MQHDSRAELTVAELLERWPAAARVFFGRRMACVGCSMSRFDTVAEAAATYGIESRLLVAELARATRGGEKR